jgi:hypothetical protein
MAQSFSNMEEAVGSILNTNKKLKNGKNMYLSAFEVIEGYL